MKLSDPIVVLKGMGPKTREIFLKQGITTLEDLLYFFPRAWIDASHITPMSALRLGMSGLLQGQVVMVREGISQRTRLPYMRVVIADASGSVEAMWFHPKYLRQTIKPGATLLFYGRLTSLPNGSPLMVSPKLMQEPGILPLYSEIGGISTVRIRTLFKQLSPLFDQVEDYVPQHILTQNNLLGLGETLKAMHLPPSLQAITDAKRRLGFNELLLIMLPTLRASEQRQQEQTEAITPHESILAEWEAQLPFALTEEQKRAIASVRHDVHQTKPMNRLLQGDVGSGKTAVGLAVALEVIASGKQVVWLAPTELLAQQHYETAKRLLLPILQSKTEAQGVGLLTAHYRMLTHGGEQEKASEAQILQQSLIIGTHALFSDKIRFERLGLLIIDEQHRFGVKQRAQLRFFGGKPIHLLSMTATPIPRTMALLVYGDLELSQIKHRPTGRKPVITRIVTEDKRQAAYSFIDAHIKEGRQVYVVCPTIEPAKDEEATVFSTLFETIEEKKAVVTWFEHIKKYFPARRIGLLHGKLKSADKTAVMEDFRAGKIDILVTTTVIEVGVDVPNATIMVIEAAERFGLAQLHQLRGRVGRGEDQSFCLLFPSDITKSHTERLNVLEETTDGFVLAEKDLALRGPGELTGLAQSGLPTLRFASLQDEAQLSLVKQVAHELLHSSVLDPSLERFWRMYHPE